MMCQFFIVANASPVKLAIQTVFLKWMHHYLPLTLFRLCVYIASCNYWMYNNYNDIVFSIVQLICSG